MLHAAQQKAVVQPARHAADRELDRQVQARKQRKAAASIPSRVFARPEIAGVAPGACYSRF
jgi:hypothetical protein